KDAAAGNASADPLECARFDGPGRQPRHARRVENELHAVPSSFVQPRELIVGADLDVLRESRAGRRHQQSANGRDSHDQVSPTRTTELRWPYPSSGALGAVGSATKCLPSTTNE